MSGHSKWSQIKRQKGVVDAKRGQVFTKLAKIITVAAKLGGGDPTMNPRLRIAVELARAENMPKDNIERAIKRGTGELGGAAIEELRFEAYGPGGVGILIDVATDNHLRSNSEIKATLNKQSGKLAAAGAVAFQFANRGVILVPFNGQSLQKDEVELAIIETGAATYEDQDDAFVVYTDPKLVGPVKDQLEKSKVSVGESRLSWEPLQTITISEESTVKQLLRLLGALEDLEDVTAVTANFEIPDEVMTKLE